MVNFVYQLQDSIKRNWNRPAVGDFGVSDRTYGELAENNARLKVLWQACGIHEGDKVAINAKSSANWIQVFMAAVSGGFVSVELFNGFLPKDTMNLVNHSESRILYTEGPIFDKMDFEAMPDIVAAIDLNTMEVLASRGDFQQKLDNLDKLMAEAYPGGFGPENVDYSARQMDDICAIMYTSGSTGNPKGVMLSYKNISWNVEHVPEYCPYKEGETYTSILPYAHIFGLVCDGIIPLCIGMHTVVLCKPPIPSNVEAILREYKPRIFFAVPLVLSKFVEYTVGAELRSEEGQMKMADYTKYPEYCQMLKDKVMMALGGRIETFLTGGAAIPPEVESLLAFKLKLPFATGYGMTETAPVLSIGRVGQYKARSCGEVLPTLQARIDSPDMHSIAGELQIKGDNVFAGYYKNPEATAAAFTEDGWLHTGDMGTIDEDNILFLLGRCKSMILSENGQNVYPEEIESILNALPYVAESLIVQRGNCIHAIIVPNADRATMNNLDAQSLQTVMESNVKKLNISIPQYAKVTSFEMRMEPFAKTPKGSIKRFMYA